MKTLNVLKLALLISGMFLGFTSNAQEWFEMTKKDHVNYYEVVKVTDAYYETHDRGPGSGYKLYQRWKYFSQRIMDDKGNIPSQSEVLVAKKRFDKKYSKYKKKGAFDDDWIELGPTGWKHSGSWNPGVGRITALAVEKNNQQLMFAGSPGGGIWRSRDAAQNWQPLGDQMSNMHIYGIGIDPFNSNNIYAINGAGLIIKSTNQGDTWSEIFNTFSGISRNMSIIFHPNNPGTLLIATSAGVWKSTNSGTSFNKVLNTYVEDVAYKPGDPNTVYACGNRFYKSTNGGDSFSEKSAGIVSTERLRLAVTPANNNYVYLVQKSGGNFGHLYRSTNSGESFTERAATNTPYFTQAHRDMAIMVSSTNAEEVHVAGMNNHRSRDGGNSFTLLSAWSTPTDPSYIHADVEVMKCINDVFYTGSDGGVFRSTNHGDNYTDLSSLGGLAVHQFYRISGTPQDPDFMIGGSQDNGVNIMRNKEKEWSAWLGADGMEAFVDPTNSNIIYGMTQNGGMNKSINGGASRTNINQPASSGNWVTPFFVDPSSPSNIYAGYDGLYRSTDRGNTWTKISNGANVAGNLDEATIAPSNNNYIYMARGSSLWRTTNGQSSNPTWTLVNGFTGYVNFIAVDPNNPARVAIACSGSRVYVSNDAGSNWTNKTLNLPNTGANCVVFDDNANNGLYVGTENSVYYINDGLSSWSSFSSGLPATRVNDIDINFQTRKIRVGTYGRGMLESSLYNENSTNPTTGLVTVFDDCNYGGFSVGLNIGDYNMTDLANIGVPNDRVSSLRVTQGYKAMLYQHHDFGGNTTTINSDNSCLNTTWNNEATSIRVRPNGTTNLNGTYYLQNRGSNLYLDVNGGISATANGIAIIQSQFNGNSNQKFELTDRGDGSYSIIANHSGKGLDVANASTTSGDIIHQWTYDGLSNQRFILYPTDNGFYKLVAEHTGMIAETSTNNSGEQLRQRDNHNGNYGQWKLVEITTTNEPSGFVKVYDDCNYSGSFAAGLNIGDYNMSDLASLSVPNDRISAVKVTEGYKVTLYENNDFGGNTTVLDSNNPCLDANWNNQATSVKVRPNGTVNLNGNYYLQNRSSNLYMDVNGGVGATGNGVAIIQSQFTGYTNQQFEITDIGDGTYTLIAKNSGKAVDVANNSTVSGDPIHQWAYAGNANQRFILHPTSNGYYKLIAEHTGMVIETSTNSSGEQLLQKDNHSGNNAQWQLIPVEISNGFDLLIQAEDYTNMNGIQVENTSDTDGGENVGWIDTGDWMAFADINFPSSGNYKIEYRVASPNGSQLSSDLNAGTIQLGAVNIPATGGWQNWTTVSHIVSIDEGTFDFGVFAPQSGWNINWIRITSSEEAATEIVMPMTQPTVTAISSSTSNDKHSELGIYPNPINNVLNLVNNESIYSGSQMIISNSRGKIIYDGLFQERTNLHGEAPGMYIIQIISSNGKSTSKLVMKK